MKHLVTPTPSSDITGVVRATLALFIDGFAKTHWGFTHLYSFITDITPYDHGDLFGNINLWPFLTVSQQALVPMMPISERSIHPLINHHVPADT